MKLMEGIKVSVILIISGYCLGSCDKRLTEEEYTYQRNKVLEKELDIKFRREYRKFGIKKFETRVTLNSSRFLSYSPSLPDICSYARNGMIDNGMIYADNMLSNKKYQKWQQRGKSKKCTEVKLIMEKMKRPRKVPAFFRE